MSDREGWFYWQGSPPYEARIVNGALVAVPRYKVIEWRRSYDPPEKEPSVAKVADLVAPQNQAWNVAELLWRPVM